ncbi:hypothetical protein Acr_00g0062280 [Actinidia rufa]|uniref:Retrotransposon gag domain-containing protein n=1 Tax=Actinidia rufa TaxID=165716 RepID=A0A7J0DPF1_9ERIC|nr:hypothetical protein Acr_00g0062280 [Actinidia rufa]
MCMISRKDMKCLCSRFKVSWPWRRAVGHHVPTIRIGRVAGRDRVVSEHKVNMGAAEPEDRVDRIERILEGLVQIVHDVHNNNNHDDAPQQPAIPVPEAGAMPRTTIKQFQQLKPPTFSGTPDPMVAESWLLGIERVFEVLPCTDEQKVVFATFMFEGAALIWWQLKKPLEPLWLWPRFLEVFNEEYFPRWSEIRRSRVLEFKAREMIVVVYNAKFMELSRYALNCVDRISQGEKEVLHAALIAEESLNEMSQFPRKSKEEDRRKCE